MVFEAMIEHTNQLYRRLGVALVHKVPTEWKPIRNGSGAIISAKVERKAAVDFLGVWEKGSLAFDAKSTILENRWYLKNLDPEQYRFLLDHRNICPFGSQFILLGFMKLNVCFIVDIDYLEQKWNRWKDGGGASLSVDELYNKMPSLSLDKLPIDYLGVLAEYKN